MSALDNAIDAMADQSSDWQIVVQTMLAKLDQDARQLIAGPVTDVVNRGIAATGSEFWCNGGFVRDRVRQALMKLRGTLLGTKPTETEPALCTVAPFAVDRSRVPGRLNLVDFYGYDLDKGPVQVFLLNGAGKKTDVSSTLDVPTHYHMTLNLGPTGVQLTPDSQRFLLRWHDKDIATIAIIQPQTRVCASQPVSFKPNPVTFVPPKVEGDGDFAGHGPWVAVYVSLSIKSGGIDALIAMHARETQPDWTTASGSETIRIYSPPPGERVEQIVGQPLQDYFSYTDTNTLPDTFGRPSGGPVLSYTFIGDTDGDEAGSRTQVTVTFNEIRLVLTEVGNCVSPLDFFGARSQNALSDAVRVRVEHLLINVPGEIKRLKPDVFNR